MKVTVDMETCNGFAHCVIEAPAYFDLDDSDKVLVLRDDVAASDEAEVRLAAMLCPVRAIEIVE